jgi:hypothetical protein
VSRRSLPWWAYDAGIAVVAVVAVVAALALHPGDDPRWVYLPNGDQFGDTCGFLAKTGLPCPQCGMTRAFVHGVRGHFVRAFLASPGGFALFAWIEVAGAIGAYRLLRRDPFAVVLPWKVPVYWAMTWMTLFYLLPWLLRLGGVNPLP